MNDKRTMPIWADPDHETNQVQRPRTVCWGCGKKGCIDKHWGDWCFACNLARMTRLDASFSAIAAALGTQS
jgi:hypothetical protein